jgi:hypothetical protein
MACRVLRRVVRRKAGTMAEIPLVVNATLALELYFKSLLTLEETAFPKKHDLELLFGLLSDRSKRKLIREHKKWEANPIFARLIADGISPDLLTLLHIGRNSFERFRYRFEHLSDGTIWGLDACLMLSRDIVFDRLRLDPDAEFVELHKQALDP